MKIEDYKLELPIQVEVIGDEIKISYNKLDLEEMEKSLDKVLYNETEESLKEWLNKKRKL